MKDFTARGAVFWCIFHSHFYLKKRKKRCSNILLVFGFIILFGCGKKGDPQPIAAKDTVCSAGGAPITVRQYPKGVIPLHQYPKK